MSNQGCEKNKSDSNKVDSGLIILPENPIVQNEILIIEEICSYDILGPLIINGNNIKYTRHFDSRILAPCVLMMDTISLGQLEEGHYTIMYILIDKALLTSDSIVGTDEVNFYVAAQ